jgi:lycopene cyclase domain-containing protein
MNRLYLFVDLLSLSVPLLFSFHPKIQFHKTWRSLFPALILTAILFLIWDALFTARGVWGFNEKYITGIRLGNLPLEEILFFICIPYACVFTYYCLNRFYTIKWQERMKAVFPAAVAAILLAIGIFHINQLYTSVTFISTGILILVFKYLFNVQWLDKYFTVYLVLLVPFFIVNGILTGSGLQEPVVWYNDEENLGIRLFTIPVEDIFYGFEMILLNIFFYEYFNSRHDKNHITNE